MKLNRRQLRKLIQEAVTDAARKRYEEFKKSMQPPELDAQFLSSFLDDEGRLDPAQFDVADEHYDDAIARSKGYKDANDMHMQEWMKDIDDENAAMKKRNASITSR